MAKRISKETQKKKAVRIILIVIIILAVLASIIGVLRRQVTGSLNDGEDEVQTTQASIGSISNTVTGTGNLTDEDVEEIILHSEVEIDEIVAEIGDTVKKGDLLATVNMSTVLSAMSDVQNQIDELDEKIGDASGNEIDDSISSSVSGRVKKVYASKSDDVSTVMYENDALALLSLDGYMAVKIETEKLNVGDSVTVTTSDDAAYSGNVETATSSNAVILISDKSADYGDKVTVTDSKGTELGTGTLYIHEEMKITGIAGTISSVNISENQEISAGKVLFSLTDTSFSANYNSLLKERKDLEEQLQQLITIYRDGYVLAPFDGVISSVGSSTESSSQGSYGSFSSGDTAQASTSSDEALLSISPGTKMTVSINVDETDILSLEEGQKATISVDALENETAEGTVTEIDTTATSSGGVTVYTVTVAFDKTENMLSGMSASVAIAIEGVENALIIPGDALTQTSASSYVYTSYDEETGELGGMVEVTTGMNNGDYVEITEGLSEGDTVYYFEKENNRFNFGGMKFGNDSMSGSFGGNFQSNGGGGRPSGGSTPGGGSIPGGFGN